MTLSKAELLSITPFLQEFLLAKTLQAVQQAVETGDGNKLPKGFSRSCLKRKPILPSNTVYSDTLVNLENVTESAAAEEESTSGPLNVQIKCEPVDEMDPNIECQGLELVSQVHVKLEETEMQCQEMEVVVSEQTGGKRKLVKEENAEEVVSAKKECFSGPHGEQ
jgi:hypothetical protein